MQGYEREVSLMPYVGWTIEADEVVSMSVDELGLRILDDVVLAAAGDSRSPNEHTWCERSPKTTAPLTGL